MMAGPLDKGEDEGEDGDVLDATSLQRWPLQHLRRQLIEGRQALHHCEARVVASARAAGVAQEALAQLSRKHQTLRLQLDVLRREVVMAEREAAAMIEPLGEKVLLAREDAARDRAKREAADAACAEAQGALDGVRRECEQAMTVACGERDAVLAAVRAEHDAVLTATRAERDASLCATES